MALTPEQRRVLAEIKAAPSYKRATPKVRKALIEAALVESNLSTPDQAHSDRDSEGVLQQRPSTGWGPTSESNTTDAEQFLRRAIPLRNKYGSAGALAQAVQRSAFPGRYNQRGAMASALLGGGSDGGGRTLVRGSRSSGGRPASTRTTIETTPGVDNRFARASLIQSFLDDDNSDVLDFAVQAKALADVPATSTRRTVRTPGVPATAGRAASSGGGRVSGARGVAKITGPNPGRIIPGVRDFMREISAVRGGKPVVGSDGTGHSYLTVNGNVSEHSTGHASDIPASGRELINLGQAALIAAGMPRAQARQKTGGLFNVTRNGRRYQIIFNTHEGGDHTDHLHVGIKGGR